MGAYVQTLAILLGINLILAAGLHLITGLTGQFSLGHAAFAGIGAYTSALLSMNTGLPFAACLAAGSLAAALIGWLLAFPCNRFRGDYLALVTLGFGEIVRIILLNMKITNGALGLYGIPSKTGIASVLIVAFVFMFLCGRLEKSRPGRAMRAVRQDSDAAQAMGIDINASKQVAFILGVAGAGVAGGLYAHYLTYINPGDFGFMRSIEILLCVILGGIGDLRGVLLGTATLTVLPELLRAVSEFRVMAYGILLVIVMIYQPSGLAGLLRKRGTRQVPPQIAAVRSAIIKVFAKGR